MKQFMSSLAVSVILLSMAPVCYCEQPKETIVWDVNNIKSIGGHKTEVLGSPKVIETPKGKAVQFDGVKDGFIIDALPLVGVEKFTIEVIFRPDPNGIEAQKFLHMQESNSNNRILIVSEITPGNEKLWYLDTYIKSDKGTGNLYKPASPHPIGKWYNATLVCDGQQMRHYVDGVMEISKELEFSPLSKGKTSIGAKLGRKAWFKGAICKVRFTKLVLKPEEFLKP